MTIFRYVGKDIKWEPAKRETQVIGKVMASQLKLPETGKWMLARISPVCEKCGTDTYYHIQVSYLPLLWGLVPFVKRGKRYQMACPECGETTELDYSEYLTIEPFLRLNNLYEAGKIDEADYQEQLEALHVKMKATQ